MPSFFSGRQDIRPAGGFTLLEMLLVCAIILVMVATVSASMGGMVNRSHLRATAARVSTLAIFARSHALTSGRKVVMAVDPPQGEVSLLQPEEQSGELVLIDESWRARLPQDVAIDHLEIDGRQADQGEITFYAEGGAQSATIVLGTAGEGQNSRRAQRTLTINKITGRVKVE
jgi:Tfp pilus assembly protein FimT